MPVLSNPQHEAFAVLIANGETAMKAYVAVGFKDSPSAMQNSSRLYLRDEVQIRIEELRERASGLAIVRANEGIEKMAISRARVLQRLTLLGEKAERTEQWSAALRAEELIGKELGMFRDRVEMSGPEGGPIDNNVVVRFVE